MVKLARKICAIAIFAALATVCISTNTFAASVEVDNFTDFQTAIANGDNVKLTDDISATGDMTFTKPLTIDLNGRQFKAQWAQLVIDADITVDDTSSAKMAKYI
ncbi:hypothetical protein IK110_01170 [Candidatus Saccharibacteria bacterium]|nr:hypothetical protein [Candidatus Saccharibacteria bacterium]